MYTTSQDLLAMGLCRPSSMYVWGTPMYVCSGVPLKLLALFACCFGCSFRACVRGLLGYVCVGRGGGIFSLKKEKDLINRCFVESGTAPQDKMGSR